MGGTQLADVANKYAQLKAEKPEILVELELRCHNIDKDAFKEIYL